MGLRFIEKAVDLMGRFGYNPSNCLQTNGLLVDDDWAHFLLQYNFLVVKHTGDVEACDFLVEPDWYLENIHQDRMIFPTLGNSFSLCSLCSLW